MASKEQIFGILAGASGSMSRVELEDKVGEKYQAFQSQLDRWVKQELLEDTGEHHYVLTDKGREEALKRGEFKDIDNEPGFAEPAKQPGKPATEEPGLVGDEPTQESLATTEYQQFLRLGKITGVVPLALIKQTADYIWEGGDFRDMTWVAQAMKDMDIRQDLRGRWWNSWRVKMHKAIPTDLPVEFLPPESKKAEEKSEAEKKAGTGKRDYILSEEYLPVHVGDGLGDLDHDEAVVLAKLKAAAIVRGSGQSKSESPGDALAAKAVDKIIADIGQESSASVDEAAKFLGQYKAFMELQGLNAKPDSNDDLAKFSAFYKFVKEIIGENKQAVTNPNSVKQLVWDKQTGKVEEVPAGQTLVLFRDSTPVSQSTPIQVTDKDGKPMVLDLSTYIKLEEHRDKQHQDQESHETKMEIAKTFKEMLKKAGTALSHMGEGEEE